MGPCAFCHWRQTLNHVTSFIEFISPSRMVPEKRLETLLHQAIEFQRLKCIYHNVNDERISLYEDHICQKWVLDVHIFICSILNIMIHRFFFSFRIYKEINYPWRSYIIVNDTKMRFGTSSFPIMGAILQAPRKIHR